MSDKPKIYANCKAGCLWETVHRSEFEETKDVAETAKRNHNTHLENKDNPHSVTAAQTGAVPVTRKVNGKSLSNDVSLTAEDIGGATKNAHPAPDTTVSSVKPVPETSAPYAEVVEIGGRTRKCTNLMPYPYAHSDKTASGLTWSIKDDRSIEVSGTSTATSVFRFVIKAQLPSYPLAFHLICSANISGVQPRVYLYDEDDTMIKEIRGSISNTLSFSAAGYPTAKNYTLEVAIITDVTVNNLTLKAMLNEGSTALPYEPYFEGLRSAPVTEVESVGRNIFGGDALADKLVEVAGATKDEDVGTVEYFPQQVNAKMVFDKFKENTQYTFIFYGVCTESSRKNVNLEIKYANGTKKPLSFSTAGTESYCVFTNAANTTIENLHGCHNTGNTVLYYDKCGIFEGVLTEADFEPYFRNTLPIPEAVRNLDGYGEGNPDNAEEYNAIICKDGKWKYSHKGDIDNNVWTALAEPVITDISDLLPDNLIGVEDGGTLTMVNEYGYDVPNTVNFYKGTNEIVGAKQFVGSLIGTAGRALCDSTGRDIAAVFDSLLAKIAELESKVATEE